MENSSVRGRREPLRLHLGWRW